MIGWILKIVGLLLLIDVLLYLKSFQSLLKHPQKPDEKIIHAKQKNGASIKNPKKALLLYQESKHGSAGKMAKIIAEDICAHGYDVTINHPSDKLDYDPTYYDLLVFGSPAYLGSSSPLLTNFIKANPFTHKTVLIFITGLTPEDIREIEQIRTVIPKHNRILSIKIHKNDQDKLGKFLKNSSLYQDYAQK